MLSFSSRLEVMGSNPSEETIFRGPFMWIKTWMLKTFLMECNPANGQVYIAKLLAHKTQLRGGNE